MKNQTIYLDMDGVVANFDEKATELSHLDEKPWLSIPGFFRQLAPIGDPNSAVIALQEAGYKVKILTKVETRDTNARAMDKILWLQEFMPAIQLEDIIIVPYHLSKTNFVTENPQNCILVDDYGKNLIEWQNFGGFPIKFRPSGNFKKPYNFVQIASLTELLDYL